MNIVEIKGEGCVIQHIILPADGNFPNNPKLPAVLYKNPLHGADGSMPGPEAFESVFEEARWSGSWRNGVYSYHHYHSNTHEVLGCYGGSAEIQLGGQGGIILSVEHGDIVVIPAGVAHMNTGSKSSFGVVGAYPDGRSPDMRYGKADELDAAKSSIGAVPLPTSDPAFPGAGILLDLWK